MKKIIIVLLLLIQLIVVKLHAQAVPYISPGIQLGYGFRSGFFYGGQITLGVAFEGELTPWAPGISLGIRKYTGKEKILMQYLDLQFATMLGGVGFGSAQIKTKDTNTWISTGRFKIWGGFLGYFSYDIYRAGEKRLNHNVGLIGFLPIGDFF